ncbi:MAG: hypothetical protein NZ828_03010 [Alphaproteobacteria bacterium]|nr:hypothetical protein [Alphaproteobacteria bacterium]MCS5596202.1 hypothetical protein [Alphaproteobacteria bacterium]|tara:strand:+ start:1955 stop:2464 length:510 start_codon:yes stop_codon:yes gene_type:complete
MDEKDEGYLGDTEVKHAHSICLIVSDKIEHCEKLLYYIMRYVKKTSAGIGIIHVSQLGEYQHWANVEEQMRNEIRAQAEEEVYTLANRLAEHIDVKPVFYFREGDWESEVVKAIKEDSAISGLFLAGKSGSRRYDDLLKFFAGKGMEQLTVPLTIVPDHLDYQDIDELI